MLCFSPIMFMTIDIKSSPESGEVRGMTSIKQPVFKGLSLPREILVAV